MQTDTALLFTKLVVTTHSQSRQAARANSQEPYHWLGVTALEASEKIPFVHVNVEAPSGISCPPRGDVFTPQYWSRISGGGVRPCRHLLVPADGRSSSTPELQQQPNCSVTF